MAGGARAKAGNAAARFGPRLRQLALSLPEAHEDFPWGERVVKVGKKVFVFLGGPGEGVSLSVKLPSSGREALLLPFTEPTGYGLGKSGWVTARFDARDEVPLAIVGPWIEESYRAIAPRRLVTSLEERAAAPPSRRRRKA